MAQRTMDKWGNALSTGDHVVLVATSAVGSIVAIDHTHTPPIRVKFRPQDIQGLERDGFAWCEGECLSWCPTPYQQSQVRFGVALSDMLHPGQWVS